MSNLSILLLSTIISIPYAILGTHIGLWLTDNFSIHKIIKFIKREKVKYLL